MKKFNLSKSLKKNLTLFIALIFMTSAFSIVSISDPVEDAIVKGIDYLLSQQDQTTGGWGLGYFSASQTAFVLIKLQDRAYELEMDPFETDEGQADYCPWSENITAGWVYLFNFLQVVDIHLQTAGDPDTNGNTYGVRLYSPDPAYGGTPRPPYETGVVLMAFAASQAPDRNDESNIDINAPFGINDTFGQIAQEAVDYLAFVQQDSGAQQGGWHYYEFDNSTGGSDNSVGGYAVLGLAAAEDFGCTVPGFVKTELNLWIDYIQNDANGGSGYNSPTGNVNLLKTGNLIFQMTYFGDPPTSSRFLHALDYIGDHWQDPLGVGYGYGAAHPPYPYYQTMYCLMKGLVYSGVELIDENNDDIPEYDWFADLEANITSTQQPDGSWPQTPNPYYSTTILSTVWALLVLEKITPEPPQPPDEITVEKDFRYTSVDFTPYHWEDPDGIPDSGDEYIVQDPAILGDLLPMDGDNYIVKVVMKKKKNTVSSTNPGQLYGVITITGPVSKVYIEDYFDKEFDINPQHYHGGIEVIIVDPDGYATVITGYPGLWGDVWNDDPFNDALISINLTKAIGEPLQSGHTLMIYVKFQTAMKHQIFPGGPYDSAFWNRPQIWINDDEEPYELEEIIELSIK